MLSVQQVRNLATGQCVDSNAKPEDNHKPVGLWPCHKQGGNQVSEAPQFASTRRGGVCSVVLAQEQCVS